MIIYITEMTEIPSSCKDYPMEDCRLPLKARRYKPTLKKRYTTKRHSDCPLREISTPI